MGGTHTGEWLGIAPTGKAVAVTAVNVDGSWVGGSSSMEEPPTFLVHAAEEGGSAFERLVDRALYRLGVAPPYWRFLSEILRVPPLPALRRRYPPVRAAHAP